MLVDYDIIITTSQNKKKITRTNKTLNNIKIYEINEFKKKYFFDYNKKAIFYIMSKYNVNCEIAEIYINNLYYIDDKDYSNKKLSFLKQLKNDLLSQNLLIINKLFRNYLKKKRLCFYNISLSKELNYLINNLNNDSIVEYKKDLISSNSHLIYEAPSIEEEVLFIANKICELLVDNIPIEKIYLTNLNDDYRRLIKRYFPMFNIPITLENTNTIYGTFLCQKFLEVLSNDLDKTFNILKEYIHNEKDEYIYNQIINIINEYTFIEDKISVKHMIINDLKKITLPKEDLIYSVHESSIGNIFEPDDYVFLLSFNQGIIPTLFKDENYLSDKDIKELDISYTVDKNKNTFEELITNIKQITNLIITYKKLANGEEYNISNANDTLNYSVEKITVGHSTYSNLYNKIKLTSLLDEYEKYGTTSELLYSLKNHYSNMPYKTYNNKFKGINPQSLKEFLNNKLTLSYSSLDTYYRCPFSYYIGNILKLNVYEETFYQLIGTLFHSVLEKISDSKLSYEELFEEEKSKLKSDFTNQELFFLQKLKEELKFIVDIIQNQENFTNLHNELHEERVYTNIEGSIKITFTGIIDKIKYKETNDETIIAIIDYKTGNPNLDLTTIKYGIGMQLPIYLYLAKNSKKLKNIKVAGFYLQKILHNEVTVDKVHTYEQLKKKNLALQGYSNSDSSILSEFDNSYEDSNIIKSMKTTKDGNFSHYSKVLSSKEMDIITEIAEDKIKEGAKKIERAEFEIAPKKIGKDNYGCPMCKFKDVCYYTNNDIEELEPLELSNIIGGE